MGGAPSPLTRTGIRVVGLGGAPPPCAAPASCRTRARSRRTVGARTHTGTRICRVWRAHLHHALVQLHAECAHGLVRRQARELVQALLDKARSLVWRLRRRLDHLCRLRGLLHHQSELALMQLICRVEAQLMHLSSLCCGTCCRIGLLISTAYAVNALLTEASCRHTDYSACHTKLPRRLHRACEVFDFDDGAANGKCSGAAWSMSEADAIYCVRHDHHSGLLQHAGLRIERPLSCAGLLHADAAQDKNLK